MIEQVILIDAARGELLVEDIINDIEILPVEQIHIEIIKTTREVVSAVKIPNSFEFEIPEYQETVKIVGFFLVKRSSNIKKKEVKKTIIRITDGYVAKYSDDLSPFYDRRKGLELLHCKLIKILDETITLQKVEFECNELYYIKKEEDPQDEFYQLLS